MANISFFQRYARTYNLELDIFVSNGMYSIVSWDTFCCIRARYWGDEHGMWNALNVWKTHAELSSKYLTLPATDHLGSSELAGRTAVMAITEI